jgi:hypothetical protein
MTPLEIWIKQATRHLSADSAAKVRTEIQEHYEAAREAAIGAGSTPDDADRIVVTALGDAKIANHEYRRVLLTADEVRLLGEGNREARFFCSKPWLKFLFLSIPAAILLASLVCLLKGKVEAAKGLLEGAIGVAAWSATPFLPVYTRWRGRFLRIAKWGVLLAMLVMMFQWSWLFISCLWPMVWVEWTRVSIRRKIPVGLWPKQLYL